MLQDDVSPAAVADEEAGAGEQVIRLDDVQAQGEGEGKDRVLRGLIGRVREDLGEMAAVNARRLVDLRVLPAARRDQAAQLFREGPVHAEEKVQLRGRDAERVLGEDRGKGAGAVSVMLVLHGEAVADFVRHGGAPFFGCGKNSTGRAEGGRLGSDRVRFPCAAPPELRGGTEAPAGRAGGSPGAPGAAPPTAGAAGRRPCAWRRTGTAEARGWRKREKVSSIPPPYFQVREVAADGAGAETVFAGEVREKRVEKNAGHKCLL